VALSPVITILARRLALSFWPYKAGAVNITSSRICLYPRLSLVIDIVSPTPPANHSIPRARTHRISA
jgi:hypothetical protein